MYGIEMKIPEEIMDRMPTDLTKLVEFLLPYASKMVDDYEQSFLARTKNLPLGGKLTRYERSQLTDFILDRLVGPLRDKLQSQPEPTSLPRSA